MGHQNISSKEFLKLRDDIKLQSDDERKLFSEVLTNRCAARLNFSRIIFVASFRQLQAVRYLRSNQFWFVEERFEQKRK